MTDVSQLIEQRFADNTTGDITPGDARAVAHALAEQAPNQRRDLLKAFRFFRQEDRDADAYGGTCVETDLDYASCCLQTVVRVEFYREAATENYRQQDLVCVYDPAATPAGHAWRSGDFADGGQLPAKLVPVASAEAAQVNVPYYVTATPYVAGFVVRYQVAGGSEAFYSARQAGQLPAPTGADNDPNWALVPGPVGALALWQPLTLVQARNLASQLVEASSSAELGPVSIQPGRLYRIALGANGAGQAQEYYVEGQVGGFDAEGTLAVGGTRTKGTLNLATGTFTARAMGTGNVTQQQLTDGLATKADLDPATGKVRLDQVPRQVRFPFDYDAGQTQAPWYKLADPQDAGFYTIVSTTNVSAIEYYVNDQLTGPDPQGRLVLAYRDKIAIRATAGAGAPGLILFWQLVA